MYVHEYHDHHVEVTYISAHTGHELGTSELPFLTVPKSIKESISLKLSQGVPIQRIMDGTLILLHA